MMNFRKKNAIKKPNQNCSRSFIRGTQEKSNCAGVLNQLSWKYKNKIIANSIGWRLDTGNVQLVSKGFLDFLKISQEWHQIEHTLSLTLKR